MKQAAIYVRQSRTRDGSESIDIQVEACKEAATRLGAEVVAEMIEAPSTSGYKNRGKSRKQWVELLKGFRDHRFEMVIAYKTDRLSRGGGPGWAPLLEAIEDAGLDVDRAVATPSGFVSEFEIGIRAAMDREESKKLSERLQDVDAKRAASGKPHGGQQPYGYEKDQITVNPEQAAVIREMVRRYLSGHSFPDIAWWANEHGYKTQEGNLWHGISVKKLFDNKRLVGIRSHGGVDYKAVWQPILDIETWDRLQLAIKVRSGNNVQRIKARKYLLTGLVFCGNCGHAMTGDRRTDHHGMPERRLYTCRPYGRTERHGGCGSLRRNADALDHYVRELILYRLDTPALAKLLNTHSDDDKLRHLLTMRDTQAQRVDALIDDYATGLLSKPQFIKAKTSAEAELQRWDKRIEELTKDSISLTMPIGKTLRQAWDSNPDSWKRKLIDLVIERIEVLPSSDSLPFYDVDGKRSRFDPERVRIHWRDGLINQGLHQS